MTAITTRKDPAARARLDALARQAQATRAALIKDARARGVTGLRCEECGYVHPLERLGYPCNAAHWDNDNHDGEPCGSYDLREVRGAHHA